MERKKEKVSGGLLVSIRKKVGKKQKPATISSLPITPQHTYGGSTSPPPSKSVSFDGPEEMFLRSQSLLTPGREKGRDLSTNPISLSRYHSLPPLLQ